MKIHKKQLLLIEDDEIDQMAFVRFANKKDFHYNFDISASVKDAKKILETKKYDIIVSDFFLGDGNAFDILKDLKDTPMVITTGVGDEGVAVKAMKLGAYDYLIKDINGQYLNMLPITVNNAVMRFRAEQELKEYHENLEVLIDERTAELKQEIAERIKAEETIRSSEERLKILFESAPDAYYLSDKKGNFLDGNKAAEELIGYKKEKLIGTTIFNLGLVSNNQFSKITKSIANSLLGKKSGPEEFILKHKDGHKISVEISTFPVKIKNKMVVLGIARDLTKRKEAEKEIKESENRFQAFMNYMPAGIFIKNADGNYLFSNKFNNDRFNINNIIGKSVYDFLPKEIADGFTIEDRKVLNGKNLITEGSVVDKYGKLFYYKNYIFTIEQPEGKKLIGGISFDVTKEKIAEKELLKLSAAVKQSPSVIAITDLKGRLEYVNPKFTEITGYTFDEAKGENPRILNAGEQSNEIYKDLWTTISAGKEWHGEFLNKKKNGKLFWESASISAIFNNQGEIINYLKVAEDITVRKQAEEKLKKSKEQLRGLTKYMDAKFEEEKKRIGKEIHDGIGQLLTGLKMDLQWIINKWPKESEQLNNKFTSMKNIIDIGVKEVQKLSIQLRPEMLDKLGLLETIKSEVKKFEERTGINCEVQFKPDIFEVEYDRSTTLYRILMEVLTNIYRYAKASKVDIKFEMNNDGYLFTVNDNGVGITENQINDKSSFGLMTITERVNKWNGTFTISGEHKKGTKVEITIPFD